MISIILAIIALLGNCGWFVAGRKYRQEVRQVKAQANQDDLNIAVQYVNEFKTNIYAPLQEELRKLRAAIEAIQTCPHCDDCPVLERLRHQLDSPQVPGRNRNHQD